jgi:tRNA (guanine-N7-)-methyltransferase
MDWTNLYPSTILTSHKRVEIVDIGCGFGGLLFALATRFPQTLMLGEFATTSDKSNY